MCTYTLYMASFNNKKWTGRTLIYLLLLLLFHCSSSLSFIAVEEYADAVTHMCTIQMMIMCRRHHRPHQLDYALIFQSFMIYKNVVDMVLSSENPAHFPSLFLLIHIYVFRFIDIYYLCFFWVYQVIMIISLFPLDDCTDIVVVFEARFNALFPFCIITAFLYVSFYVKLYLSTTKKNRA